jgi:hypothetical protein
VPADWGIGRSEKGAKEKRIVNENGEIVDRSPHSSYIELPNFIRKKKCFKWSILSALQAIRACLFTCCKK